MFVSFDAEAAAGDELAVAAATAAVPGAPLVATPEGDRGPAPVPRPAAADEPATLKLGTICDRLGFTVKAAFLEETLGIAPAGRAGAAQLFRESDFPRICDALVAHLNTVVARDWRAAA